jgi:hypothetical protein
MTNTTTLQNFGVPLGGNGGGRGGILQPKVKYKFRVTVTNFGVVNTVALTQQVATVGRPKVGFEPVVVDSYNSRAYYEGKATWETIQLVVRDDVTNAVSSLVGAQLQNQMNFFAQTTPLAGANYKFQMLIDTLDGGNDVTLEEWFLEGCFLSSVEYDDFDYSSSEMMKITMTIRYDNATQTGGIMPLTSNLFNVGDDFIA